MFKPLSETVPCRPVHSFTRLILLNFSTMSGIDLAVLYFGLFLGIFPFTLVKVAEQTRKILSRSRGLHNAYLYMIWVEALVNLVFALVTFLYLKGVIPGT